MKLRDDGSPCVGMHVANTRAFDVSDISAWHCFAYSLPFKSRQRNPGVAFCADNRVVGPQLKTTFKTFAPCGVIPSHCTYRLHTTKYATQL